MPCVTRAPQEAFLRMIFAAGAAFFSSVRSCGQGTVGLASCLFVYYLSLHNDRDGVVYAQPSKGIYECIKVNSLKSHEYKFAIKYDVVDEIFSRHLLEMLDTWTGYDTWEEKPEEKANKKEQQIKVIQSQIAEAEANIEAIVKQIEDKENPPPASLKSRLYKDYTGYERKKKELEAELKECIAQEEDISIEEQLYNISTLLPDIIESWYEMEYLAKLKIVNALVDKAILEHCSTCWYKLTIEWRREDWGVHEGYLFFTHRGGSPFSIEEDAIIREMYPEADALAIMERLPNRSWQGIHARGGVLKVKRLRNIPNSRKVTKALENGICYDDAKFMEEKGVAFLPNITQWRRPSSWVPRPRSD